LIEDIRLLVSFVNWHLWFLLEHSEHAEVSVASHWDYGLALKFPKNFIEA